MDSVNLVEVIAQLVIVVHGQARLHESEELLRRLLRVLLIFSVNNNGTAHPLFEATISNYSNLLRTMGISEADILRRLEAIQRSLSG
jgi:hypothetical protein